jgi:predicted ATP-dependent protease
LTLPQPLPADLLCTPCDTDCLGFEFTPELEPLDEVIGQERAVEAVQFGIEIERQGFNIFAHGQAGTGKSTTIQHFLTQAALSRPIPDDWCYVYNFDQAYRPRALRLPAGRGSVLQSATSQEMEQLLLTLPVLFESESYAVRRNAVAAEFTARSKANFEKLRGTAAERHIAVIQSDQGVNIAPMAEEGIMKPEDFESLPAETKAEVEARLEQTQSDLEAAARAEQQIQREAQDALGALDRDVALVEVAGRLDAVRGEFADQPEVVAYLDAVQKDILDRLDIFQRQQQGDGDGDDGGGMPVIRGDAMAVARARWRIDPRLRRYKVNVMVGHAGDAGAPVVVERYPIVPNLVGRIEHEQRYGALVTDFTLIKPGALHRANGGFLVIEADELFKHPASWDALKRALRHEEIRIEALGDDASPMTTITLDPEPIPFHCKVVLIGETGIYFTLHALDVDFPELFKVGAEFASSMERSRENDRLYACFMAAVIERETLLPFHSLAIARVIEHSARLAEDARRLSTNFLDVTDLLREADYWARRSGAVFVDQPAVEQAIAARVERADLSRDRILESYARDILLMDVAGASIGQVNGLTVATRGNFTFGLPMRITARVRMGAGEVIDIEREVEMSGPFHSKGVLILAGFLSGRYLPDESLAISASLTFEQSYGAVDGDSASSAELYALLSALSELPLRQSLAVTGSINQAGEVQAIGGVNDKIEGFFDVCSQRGLTGDQGVLIPAANVQHLMLRRSVVDAVLAGQFQVYPIRHVDEGIALLTGRPAGLRGVRGAFPARSVNRLVEDRLRRFAAGLRHSRGGARG